jgi:hypothetical protein
MWIDVLTVLVFPVTAYLNNNVTPMTCEALNVYLRVWHDPVDARKIGVQINDHQEGHNA